MHVIPRSWLAAVPHKHLKDQQSWLIEHSKLAPLCADQFESSTSPPGHLNFWRLACSISVPSGQKSRSNAPPVSTKQPLLKDKFRLQSNTLHAFQTPSNFLQRPLWKSYSPIKARFYLVNRSNPAKTEKNLRAYYVRTRDKSGSNSPPFKRNVQIPPSPGTMHSQMAGACPGGGCWSFKLIGALISEFFKWYFQPMRFAMIISLKVFMFDHQRNPKKHQSNRHLVTKK